MSANLVDKELDYFDNLKLVLAPVKDKEIAYVSKYKKKIRSLMDSGVKCEDIFDRLVADGKLKDIKFSTFRAYVARKKVDSQSVVSKKKESPATAKPVAVPSSAVAMPQNGSAITSKTVSNAVPGGTSTPASVAPAVASAIDLNSVQSVAFRKCLISVSDENFANTWISNRDKLDDAQKAKLKQALGYVPADKRIGELFKKLATVSGFQ